MAFMTHVSYIHMKARFPHASLTPSLSEPRPRPRGSFGELQDDLKAFSCFGNTAARNIRDAEGDNNAAYRLEALSPACI